MYESGMMVPPACQRLNLISSDLPHLSVLARRLAVGPRWPRLLLAYNAFALA